MNPEQILTTDNSGSGCGSIYSIKIFVSAIFSIKLICFSNLLQWMTLCTPIRWHIANSYKNHPLSKQNSPYIQGLDITKRDSFRKDIYCIGEEDKKATSQLSANHTPNTNDCYVCGECQENLPLPN